MLALGRVGEDRMEEVVAAIAKHKEIFTALELAKHISVEDTHVLGPLLILQRMFEASGIDGVLKSAANKHPKLGFDLRSLVFTMAVARFVRAGSKLKPKCVALYARVSTDDQKADLQLDALRQYSGARGFTIYREYIDHISGAKVSRPALDERRVCKPPNGAANIAEDQEQALT